MEKFSIILKISALLWIIWGFVHVLAGILTLNGVMSGDISKPISTILDAVNPESLKMDYPAALGGILNQHGFNLLWFGLITFIAAFYIWGGNKNAIMLAVIVGGLADLGYFIFIDLAGFSKFFPGTVMTLVSTSAIFLSLYAYFAEKSISKNEI